MAKRYGLTMTHPPNICPIANKASREIALSMWKNIPNLTKKHGIKMVSLDHFDPEHLVIGIFEAENVESINNFAMEAGLMAWNNLKVNALTPVSQFMDNADQMPPAIF
jgi:L-rhamnose mutarotase